MSAGEGRHSMTPPPRWAIPALAVAALLLYAFAASSHWHMGSDSARYLMMSRRIVEEGSYSFAGRPQWSIPPAVPLYYAAVFKVTGFEPTLGNLTERFTSINAAALLVGYLGLLVGFLFVREVAGTRRAVLVMLFVVASRYYFGLAIRPLSDVPYAAVTWAALWLLARAERTGRAREFVVAAVLTALAVLTRVAGVSLVGALTVYYSGALLFTKSAKRITAWKLAVILPGVAAAGWLVFAVWSTRGSTAFNYWDQLIAGRSFGTLVLGVLTNYVLLPSRLFEGLVGFESAAGLSVLFFAVVVVGFVRVWRRGGRISCLYFVGYLAFVGLTQDMLPRYVAVLLVMLCLYCVEGFPVVARWILKVRTKAGDELPAAVSGVLRALAFIVLATNLFYNGRTIAREYKPDFYTHYDHGKYADYVPLAENLIEAPPGGRVLAYWWTTVHMLSDVETVWMPHIPPGFEGGSQLLSKYISDNRIAAILFDAEDGKINQYVAEFLAENASDWKEDRRFGRLTLYTRKKAAP